MMSPLSPFTSARRSDNLTPCRVWGQGWPAFPPLVRSVPTGRIDLGDYPHAGENRGATSMSQKIPVFREPVP